MTVLIPPTTAPPISAIQKLLSTHPLPSNSPHSTDLYNLALQTAHNLHYQHLWTAIHIHLSQTSTTDRLPRPLISGIPPRRLYIHPDEQIELLQKQKDAGRSGMPELSLEREWVLPSHLSEKWSLRRFGEMFDAVSTIPEPEGRGALFEDDGTEGVEGSAENGTEWREKLPKRLLLGTLDDDSTIVYYIVHDGIVKPRQN